MSAAAATRAATEAAAAAAGTAATRLKVVLGTMEFGRGVDEAQSAEMVQTYLSKGHRELDTANMYSNGKSETFLGAMPSARTPDVLIATKINPYGGGGLSPQRLKEQWDVSSKRLATDKVDLLYLHAPDHKTPIRDTLRAVQDLYEAGRFKRLGLSNYAAWQVMEIYHICQANGWVLPTVYQGMYNVVTRAVEPELLPCLRTLNMSLYIYNPLAGGLLTGRYASRDKSQIPQGRFSGHGAASDKMYQERFWKDCYFDAVDLMQSALSKEYNGSVTLTHAVLRWLSHHSALKPEFGDAIILGASKMHHLTDNLAGCEGGPLSADVVAAFDEAWRLCKAECPSYFR